MNREPFFDLQTVVIAPRGFATLPIKICVVAVREQESAFNGTLRLKLVRCGFLTARSAKADSGSQSQTPGAGIWSRPDRTVFSLAQQRLQIELDAGADLGLGRLTALSGLFRLELDARLGSLVIRVDLGQEFVDLSTGALPQRRYEQS